VPRKQAGRGRTIVWRRGGRLEHIRSLGDKSTLHATQAPILGRQRLPQHFALLRQALRKGLAECERPSACEFQVQFFVWAVLMVPVARPAAHAPRGCCLDLRPLAPLIVGRYSNDEGICLYCPCPHVLVVLAHAAVPPRARVPRPHSAVIIPGPHAGHEELAVLSCPRCQPRPFGQARAVAKVCGGEVGVEPVEAPLTRVAFVAPAQVEPDINAIQVRASHGVLAPR